MDKKILCQFLFFLFYAGQSCPKKPEKQGVINEAHRFIHIMDRKCKKILNLFKKKNQLKFYAKTRSQVKFQ